MVRLDDWLRQTERDLEHAKESVKIYHFEWAVFAALHSAEKALKALFYEIGADPWSHSLYQFLKKNARSNPRQRGINYTSEKLG